MKYDIIVRDTIAELITAVNDALGSGWIPQGSVVNCTTAKTVGRTTMASPAFAQPILYSPTVLRIEMPENFDVEGIERVFKDGGSLPIGIERIRREGELVHPGSGPGTLIQNTIDSRSRQ